ncbi:MAG TPA: CDP-glucose 4,6-dehydratase [Clostridiales bacterium]|nr:CDP-glucose 4,6-dehydratase [Clostridiales bacterium]
MGMQDFWQGKKVFITGHTGFKGAWLSLLLSCLGAEVSGYSLEPPTEPSLFELARLESRVHHCVGDIRRISSLRDCLKRRQPQVVFHLAAQSLVGRACLDPVETFHTNVTGTVNLLEALRSIDSVKAAVIVTSDKCYSDRKWVWGYREEDELGGTEPYAASKACAEIITACFRHSFFRDSDLAVATARAGNVIGGGDWAQGRIVPDCVRACLNGGKVRIRNPGSVRPWQHVLDALSGYLMLGEALVTQGKPFAEAFNFGPAEHESVSVGEMAGMLLPFLEMDADRIEMADDGSPPLKETAVLRLDSAKARERLGWQPAWDLKEALRRVAEWSLACARGEDMQIISCLQIGEYLGTVRKMKNRRNSPWIIK